MYLYYSRDGVLKEIINDTSIRQYNYNYNKMYVYIEDPDNIGAIPESILRLEYWFELPTAKTTALKFAERTHTYASDPADYDFITNHQIPFDRKRDLKFFQYGKNYDFFVITIPTGQQNLTSGTFDANVLAVDGTVCASMRAVEAQLRMVLGKVAFTVENSVVLPNEQISESEFTYLLDVVKNAPRRPNSYSYTLTSTGWSATPIKKEVSATAIFGLGFELKDTDVIFLTPATKADALEISISEVFCSVDVTNNKFIFEATYSPNNIAYLIMLMR